MKITKFGHCCLLIEDNDTRLLTDPGNYTTEQNEIHDLDAILITHEHADHLHMDSLKVVMQNNPQAKVITNKAVAVLLDAENITYTLLSDKEQAKIKELVIEAHEAPHALIHSTLPQVLNTGFFVADKLFYPGDAYVNPAKPIDVLALPVAGPWAKASDYLDYALAVKPKRAFPVHDGMLKGVGANQKLPEMILPKAGIEYFIPENNQSFEI